MIEFIGFILAIISAIGYSLNQIFNKKLTQNSLSNLQALLIGNFFLGIFAMIIAIFFADLNNITLDKINIFLILTAGISGAIGPWMLLKSFKKLNIGEALAIANIFPFLNLGLLILFFNKTINLLQFSTMILVFIGIYILIKNKSKIKLNKYLMYPHITALVWGYYGFAIYSLILRGNDPYIVIGILEFFMFISTLFFFFIFKEKFSNNLIKPKVIFFAILVGITTTIGSLFYALSTKYINPAIASSIGSTQVAFAFIFSYLLLSEKINLKQIIGLIIITFGLMLFNI